MMSVIAARNTGDLFIFTGKYLTAQGYNGTRAQRLNGSMAKNII